MNDHNFPLQLTGNSENVMKLYQNKINFMYLVRRLA